jgi:hypothetical protein
MFDRDGNEITPTPEFIERAQAFYLRQLLGMASEDQRAASPSSRRGSRKAWTSAGRAASS